MRDLLNNIDLKPAIPPVAAITDNTAVVSTILDVQGAGSAVLALMTGAETDADATFTVSIAESDASNMAGSNAVDAAYLNGTPALASFDFSGDNVCRKIGYTGLKRYIQATITPANNTGNFFVSGVWILGRTTRRPTANPPV